MEGILDTTILPGGEMCLGQTSQPFPAAPRRDAAAAAQPSGSAAVGAPVPLPSACLSQQFVKQRARQKQR